MMERRRIYEKEVRNYKRIELIYKFSSAWINEVILFASLIYFFILLPLHFDEFIPPTININIIFLPAIVSLLWVIFQVSVSTLLLHFLKFLPSPIEEPLIQSLEYDRPYPFLTVFPSRKRYPLEGILFFIRNTQFVGILYLFLIDLLLFIVFSYLHLQFSWSLYLLLIPSFLLFTPTLLIGFLLKGQISKSHILSVSSTVINSYLIFSSIVLSIALFTRTVTWEHSILILLGITVLINLMLVLFSIWEKLKQDRIFVSIMAGMMIPYWIFPTLTFCKFHFQNFPFSPLFITAWFLLICLFVIYMIMIIKSRAYPAFSTFSNYRQIN
jgi:hypothetical protein